MRAPRPRDTDELVRAILDELKPSRRDQEEIAAEIRGWISALRVADGPALGYWVDNQKHAERLRDWIAQGEALFADMPDSFRLLMFFGEWSELFDRTDRKAISRFRRFTSLLGWLRQRCGFILKVKAGAIRSGDRHDKLGKRRAAMAARYFTERCYIPLAYSDGSPYRVTAPLFYEAMTGRKEDLTRACAAIARMPGWEEWRSRFRELRIIGRGQISVNDVGDEEEHRYIDGAGAT